MIQFTSKSVGDFVVVFDQVDEIEARRFPSVPRYTPQELHHIGDKGGVSPEMREAMRMLATAKRVFPGSVIRGDETEAGRARRFPPMFGPIKTNEEYDEAMAERLPRLSPAKMEEVA